MKNNRTIEKIQGAISLISIGSALMLINLGYFSFADVFSFFLTYWPLFVVLIGLKIIIGAFPFGKVVNLFVDLFVNIAIIAVLLFSPTWGEKENFFGWVKVQKDVVATEIGDDLNVLADDYQQIESIDYIFDIAAAEFEIKDSNQENFLEVSGEYSKNLFVPSVTVEEGESLNIEFKQSGKKNTIHFPWREVKNEFNFITNELVQSSYDINVGAGKGDVTLSSSNVGSIDLDVGAGDVVIRLGDEVEGKLDIHVGAGQIVVKIPEDRGFDVSYDVGAGRFEIKDGDNSKSASGLGRKGTVKSSSSEIVLDIGIAVGAGSVEIVVE